MTIAMGNITGLEVQSNHMILYFCLKKKTFVHSKNLLQRKRLSFVEQLQLKKQKDTINSGKS